MVTGNDEAGGVFCGAALVPGMPQLHAKMPADSWAELAQATRTVGEALRAEQPDAIVLLSTQWFTVLGHQFQMDPHPAGERADENWYAYDYGTIRYSIDVDVELTEQWAREIEAKGFQARRTRYDGFPIDTGTVVVRPLLDPDTTVPLAMVSCNIYADAEDLGQVAACCIRAARSLDRRVAFVAVSSLSSALTQRWIEPGEDRVERAENERWDRRVLELLAAGRLDDALALREEYAREAQVDSQFRALPFLAGTGCLDEPAEVRAYGPIWGTGAGVVHWPKRRST